MDGSISHAESLKFPFKFVDMFVNPVPQVDTHEYCRLKAISRYDGTVSSESTTMGASKKNKEQMPQSDKPAPSVSVQTDQKSGPEDATGDESTTDSDGLNPEQEDALNKIMAEIEGNNDPATQTSASEASTDGADDAQQPPADEAVANTEEGASDSEEGLSPEQEDALNKIMAEIEGNDDPASQASASEASTDGADDAQQPPAGEAVAGKEEEATASDEGLSPEQEDALNKIMAEIEGNDDPATQAPADEAPAHEPGDTQEQPSDEGEASAEEGDTDSEEGISPGQEDAPTQITAENETESDPSQTKAPDTDSPETAEPAQTETDAKSTAARPEAQKAVPADPNGSAPTEGQKPTSEPAKVDIPEAGDAALNEPTSNGPPPSTEDLMSQIQAAAQGSEEELTVRPASTETSGTQMPSPEGKPSESATSSNAPPPPLSEIKDTTAPAKGAASTPKRTVSKKIAKAVVWTGVAAAVVLLVATGTYFWLSRGDTDRVGATPRASVDKNRTTVPAEPSPADKGSADTVLADKPRIDEVLTQAPAAQSTTSPAPEMSAESKRLEALSERIRTHRAAMLAKAREIDDLSTYYRSGIEKITQELVDRIKQGQISDFKSAQKDTAISMGLETIQRRAGYIDKLALPHRQIQAAAEELRYLAHKADILSMIAAKSSGLNLDPFSKQVDEALERLSREVSELSIEETATAGPALNKIWDTVWSAHMKAPKKEPPATSAMRRNSEIWAEICGGDFARVGELSALSSDAASCLATWEGKDLFLNNLEKMSPEVAQRLSTWKGQWLVLNGLKSLSPKAARHLADWKGQRLSLNGLTELSAAATQALAKWQGRQIEMIGLRRLAAWDNSKVTLYVRSEVRDSLTP